MNSTLHLIGAYISYSAGIGVLLIPFSPTSWLTLALTYKKCLKPWLASLVGTLLCCALLVAYDLLTLGRISTTKDGIVSSYIYVGLFIPHLISAYLGKWLRKSYDAREAHRQND